MMTILIALFTQPAIGCASIVHSEGQLAESTGQEAILSLDGDEAVVEYRVRYEGNATDFGWIIPIPGVFSSLQDGDDSDFDALSEATAPRVLWSWDGPSSDSGCGCSRGKSDAGGWGDTAASNAVDVVAEGFAGPYTYSVVAGDDDAEVLTWLSDNGWDIGPTGPSISEYVAEGGYQFVLVALSPDDADTPTEGRNLPPIRIAYAGDDLRFPSRMAQYVPADTQHTTLYVLGDGAASLLGWSVVDDEWAEGGSGDENQVWEAYLEANDGSYVKTWSGSFGGGWATRFDTTSSAAAHTADARVELGTALDEHHLTIEVWGQPGAALIALPVIGLGLIRRRRTESKASS